MFVKQCFSCKSSAVNVLKSSNNWKTMHQFCSNCGKDQTARVLKVKNMRNSCKFKPMARSQRKSVSVGVVLVIWAILTVIRLPFMSWTVTYAASANELPKIEKLEVQETILQKIDRIAKAHGLKPEHLAKVIACESSFDPNAINKNKREFSAGLVQINTLVHNVSVEEAKDPEIAITFLAKHWKQRHNMWVTCSKGI